MEETLDLIRLLAAAPAEEPPLSRPADLMAQMKEEKVVREGLRPAGPAVPDASPNPSPGVLGPSVQWREAPHQPGPQSNLNVPEPIVGRYADPRLAAPNMPVEVSIKVQEPTQIDQVRVASPQNVPGSSAELRTQTQSPGQSTEIRVQEFREGTQPNVKVPEPVQGRSADLRVSDPSVPVEVSVKTQEPVYVEPVRVMSPETVFGRSATPYVLSAIAGLPAEVRDRGPVTAVANPNPQSRVTITVPPAFPVDPTEAFAQADSEIELPPRPGRIPQRDLGPLLPDPSESTEAEVAAAYRVENFDGLDRERWDL